MGAGEDLGAAVAGPAGPAVEMKKNKKARVDLVWDVPSFFAELVPPRDDEEDYDYEIGAIVAETLLILIHGGAAEESSPVASGDGNGAEESSSVGSSDGDGDGDDAKLLVERVCRLGKEREWLKGKAGLIFSG